MNHRHRSLAPVSDAAWDQIDSEAARALRSALAGRRLVDFVGPLGWDATAVGTGRLEPVTSPVTAGPAAADVRAGVRVSLPIVELRVEARLDRSELDRVGRGGAGPDLSPLVRAAGQLAAAEDRLVFDGDEQLGVSGIVSGSPHPPVTLGDDPAAFARQVARALTVLREAAVDGPYGVALGPRCFTEVMEASEHGGYPVLEHVRLLTGGPVVWAPALEGAVVLSMRGGDFELHVGADAGVGYARYDEETVTVFLDESLTFRNLGPEAAIWLRHG
jgi:uncharacterized linocin/CFP29 family protein